MWPKVLVIWPISNGMTHRMTIVDHVFSRMGTNVTTVMVTSFQKW